MLDVCKNGVFGDDVIDLSQLDNICLLQTFHCEILSSLFLFGENHTTEGTYR